MAGQHLLKSIQVHSKIINMIIRIEDHIESHVNGAQDKISHHYTPSLHVIIKMYHI